MEPLSAREVSLNAYVSDLPGLAVKPRMPDPIRYRAEQLADLLLREARALALRGRDELLAALIHAAPEDPATLRSYVERYREAYVWQSIVGEDRTEGMVLIPPPTQGRPSRRPEEPGVA